MASQRGLERMIAFSDAVVAIACTLLVLPLVDLAGQLDTAAVGPLLSDHLAQFGAFALSFVVIVRFWLAHHRIFEQVGGYDAMIMRLNLFWLFTIAFLPFPTALLATQSRTAASVLYVATLLASSAALAATLAWVAAHPALQRPGETVDEEHWTMPALLLVALVLTATVSGASVRPFCCSCSPARSRRSAAGGRGERPHPDPLPVGSPRRCRRRETSDTRPRTPGRRRIPLRHTRG
jgi:uncharacterized membrane protein